MDLFSDYASELGQLISGYNWENVRKLAEDIRSIWQSGRQLFLCGNGGSAANALHLANDFTYGIAPEGGLGMRVNALPSNPSVLTCLANDISYEDIFSYQLSVAATEGDLLIALSGSGNSANIVKAVQAAKRLKVKTYAILGYSGGKCLELADVPIHFPLNNMQIAEDCQLIVGHMLMSWLRDHPVR